MALCFAANYGLFGQALASHTARRPLNIALFFLLCSGSIAVCQWLGALVINLQQSRGRLAMRNLMQDLRSTGEPLGGPAPFRQSDRHLFANQLDRLLTLRRDA